MAFLKRRRPTPGFGIPPPFSPITGEHADLRTTGRFPWCAMVQIAGKDTRDDYVICRGFDPRTGKFTDYEEDEDGNPTDDDKPGIPVGKPYSRRAAGTYIVGQVFAAMIPVTRLGETPGVAETTQGHPEDLDEEVEILYDTGGNPVAWLLVDDGPTLHRIELSATYEPGDLKVGGDITASAFLVDDPEETKILLYIPTEDDLAVDQAHIFGVGRAGGSGYGGTLGYARWQLKRQRWELVVLNANEVMPGVASANIAEDAQGTVRLWWFDFDANPVAMEDSGIDVDAFNWCGPQIDSGMRVEVALDFHSGNWRIINAKPRIAIEHDNVFQGLAWTIDCGAGLTATVGSNEAEISTDFTDCPQYDRAHDH